MPLLSTNAGEILRRMHRRKESVTRELTRAAQTLAPELQREAQGILKDEIYSVEVPFLKRVDAKTRAKFAGTSRQKAGGKQIRKWNRSGDLLRRERARADGPAVVMRNDSQHAKPRNDLGTPGHRRIVTPGVRSVQWHHAAIARLRPRILRLRREAVARVLAGRA